MVQPPQSSSELKTYKGHCHCGVFKFSVTLPQIDSVLACNCTFCPQKGFLYVFPGKRDQLKVERGLDILKEYVWYLGTLHWRVSSAP